MELVKKELELDSLQRKLSVEKEAVEKKRKVTLLILFATTIDPPHPTFSLSLSLSLMHAQLDEETLKSAHEEREALERSYRALQQRLEAEPVNYLGLKKE